MHTHSISQAPAYPMHEAGCGEYNHLLTENDRKDAFMAMLGHELRNILSPLSCALQILERGGDNPTLLCQTLPVARRQVGHMSYLVEELLDLGRVLNGQMRLQCRPTVLQQVISHTVETCAPLFGGRCVFVDQPEEPIWLHADEVRLTQVITNLLHNALKFTHASGHIGIVVRRQGLIAEIAVNDDGVGIGTQNLGVIFDLFQQERHGPEAGQGGLGIGLALVRTLVELHHGTICAASNGPGTGACFTVRLPLLRDAPALIGGVGEAVAAPGQAVQTGETAPGKTAQAATPTPLRCYVIASDKPLARLCSMLGQLPTRVLVTGSASDPQCIGPELAESDVLIVDLDSMSSFEPLRALCARHSQKVLVIGSGGTDALSAAAIAGAHGAVRADEPPAALLAALERTCRYELAFDAQTVGRVFMNSARALQAAPASAVRMTLRRLPDGVPPPIA